MPKPKRRTPIVPAPKSAVNQSVPKQNQINEGVAPEVGLRRIGGGRAKRSRESNGQDVKRKDAKRRKGLALNGAWRERGRDDASGSSWRPLSSVHSQAAFAVRRLLEADSSRRHGISLKSLTLAPHIEAKKATFAVTCQVLKFSQVLEQLDEQAELTSSQPKLDKYVAMVLAYELLRGQGLQRKGPAERAVLAAEPRLRAALEVMLREAGVESLDDLLVQRQQQQQQQQLGGGRCSNLAVGGVGPLVPHPRWVRVNLLRADVEDVVRQLDEHLRRTTEHREKQQKGKQQKRSGKQQQEEEQKEQQPNLRKNKKHEQQQHHQPQSPATTATATTTTAVEAAAGGTEAGLRVVRDVLLPDLLALPPGTDLHDHPLVTLGSVVMQSKASCMPARALAPKPGWTVVDCCAAPGNKTTHLAAIMKNEGRVLAFDKDPRRLARLKANAALTGASSCVEARLADFLSLDPTAPEFREVRGVLLDPSCSGSGTTFTRLDHLLPSHTGPVSTSAATTAAAALTGAAQVDPSLAGRTNTTAGGATTAAAAVATALRDHGDQEAQQRAEQKGVKKRTKSGKKQRSASEAPEVGPFHDRDLETDQNQQQQVQQHGRLNQELTCPNHDPVEAARVAQLARFQSAALSHALRFPSLERLVYSTCSVHAEENEAVVAGVLLQAAEAGLELADPFPSWHRRGLPLFPGAEKLIRTDAYLDGTDGFFVALFQRKQPQEPHAGWEQQQQKHKKQQQQKQ